MLRTLDMYILRKYLSTLVGTFILLFGVAFIAKVHESSNALIKYEPSGVLMAQFFGLSGLTFVTYILPSAVMIAVSYTVAGIRSNMEMAAMMAAGVSFRRIMQPVIVFSLVLSVLFFVYNEYVSFPANYASGDVYNQIRKVSVTHRYRKLGAFNQLKIENRTYAIQSLSYKDKNFTGFFLSRMERDGQQIIYAESGTAQGHLFNLANAEISEIKNTGGQKVSTTRRQPQLAIELPETLESFTLGYDMDTDGEQRSIFFLKKLIEERKLIGLDYRNFQTEFYWHLGYPFIIFFVTYIGAYLGMQLAKPSLAASIGLVLIYTIGYFFVMYFGTALGGNGTLPPSLAANLANFLSIAISGWFFYRHRF